MGMRRKGDKVEREWDLVQRAVLQLQHCGGHQDCQGRTRDANGHPKAAMVVSPVDQQQEERRQKKICQRGGIEETGRDKIHILQVHPNERLGPRAMGEDQKAKV